MTRIIAVASSKGGIGKTTTSVNLSARLAHYGKSVLLIDADTQNQCADHLGVTSDAGLYEFVQGEKPLSDCLIECRERLFLLTGGEKLVSLEETISHRRVRAEETLRKALTPANEFFDFVVIDCAPSWSNLIINVLIYATETLIPVPLEMLSVGGVAKFLERINADGLFDLSDNEVRYVVPTMYDRRFAQTSEIMDTLTESFGELLTEPIRVDVRLSESAGHGETIFEYAPKSRGAVDYDQLTKFILKKR